MAYWALLWLHFPVWRELKHWYLLVLAFPLRNCNFGYTFPFEGNWNSCVDCSCRCCQTLWLHFPVWRELKLPQLPKTHRCDLKNDFGYTFPFEGNWNLKGCYHPVNLPSLATLSRLKGIETLTIINFIANLIYFGYTFPFEGNWNLYTNVASFFVSTLWLHFPVWRELKPLSIFDSFQSRQNFGYTFPFEGNWNSFRASSVSNSFSLATLSRLKGIETNSQALYSCYELSLATLSRLKGIETCTIRRWVLSYTSFGYTFPFEGNWNSLRTSRNLYRLSLATLSRLKGIET